MNATIATPTAGQNLTGTAAITVLCLADRHDPATPSVIDADPGLGRVLADITVDANPMPAASDATIINAGESATYAVGVPTDAHRRAAWMLDIFTEVVWKTQAVACPSVCVTGSNHSDVATAAVITLLACGAPLDVACSAVGDSLGLDHVESEMSAWWAALNS